MKKTAVMCLVLGFALSGVADEGERSAIVYRIVSGKHADAIGVYVERVFNQEYSILKKRKLSAEEMATFKEKIRPILSSDPSDNLCGHDPGFAIEMFRGEEIYYEASFCFKCDTIGKARKGGWARLAMAGAAEDKDQAKLYLLSLFEK